MNETANTGRTRVHPAAIGQIQNNVPKHRIYLDTHGAHFMLANGVNDCVGDHHHQIPDHFLGVKAQWL
jgi:hypothetical protein